MKRSAKNVVWILISAAIGTSLIVFLGLLMAGIAIEVAILLGRCIASATAPAAILDVAEESGCKAPFKDLLLSIVALDDAWGLILFGFGIAVVTSINGIAVDSSPLLVIIKEIGGAVMVMGAVIANLARHHEYPFHAIEGIEDTFMVIFFILAGASLEFEAINEIGLIGIIYVLCRVAGKIIGARVGSQCSKADQITKHWMGVALLRSSGLIPRPFRALFLSAAGQVLPSFFQKRPCWRPCRLRGS